MSPRRKVGAPARRTEGRDPSAERIAVHLEREDPSTTSIEIAEVWVTAYAELVDFEQKLLDRVRNRLPRLSEAARHEAELTNIPMIIEHLQTFKYRLAHWRRRRLDLEQGQRRRG
jgi:hypothetical protein